MTVVSIKKRIWEFKIISRREKVVLQAVFCLHKLLLIRAETFLETVWDFSKHPLMFLHMVRLSQPVHDEAVPLSNIKVKSMADTKPTRYLWLVSPERPVSPAPHRSHDSSVAFAGRFLQDFTSRWLSRCCGWTPWRRPGGCTGRGPGWRGLWAGLWGPPCLPSRPELWAGTHPASPARSLKTEEEQRAQVNNKSFVVPREILCQLHKYCCRTVIVQKKWKRI